MNSLSITDEQLLKIVEDISENDKEITTNVFTIVNKIKLLSKGTTTSIAKLIDYKPESSYVSPLTQGKISRYVREVCKRIKINLEQAESTFGGLAYFNEFTIC